MYAEHVLWIPSGLLSEQRGRWDVSAETMFTCVLFVDICNHLVLVRDQVFALCSA